MNFSGFDFGSQGKERCLEISCNRRIGVNCSCYFNGEHRIVVMIMCVQVQDFSDQEVLRKSTSINTSRISGTVG